MEILSRVIEKIQYIFISYLRHMRNCIKSASSSLFQDGGDGRHRIVDIWLLYDSMFSAELRYIIRFCQMWAYSSAKSEFLHPYIINPLL